MTQSDHKEIVYTVLSDHLERIQSRLAQGKHVGQLTTVMSDVNGTLDLGEDGEALDYFLCDWHDHGLPVLIATGVSSQDLPYEIVARLQGADQNRGDWFVEKPFRFSDVNPGMVFDDDQNILRVIQISGGTAWSTPDAIDFLEAWATFSPQDKKAALQPFIELHARLYPSQQRTVSPGGYTLG